MHRVKGLEFDYMLIVGVNKGVVPIEKNEAQSEDPLVSSDHEKQERALLYVPLPAPRKKSW